MSPVNSTPNNNSGIFYDNNMKILLIIYAEG